MVTTVGMITLILLATITVGVIVALLAWRQRPEPGSLPLVVMVVGQVWWSTFLIFQLQATGLESKLLFVNLSWIGVVIIPVGWVLFGMEYTGRDEFLQPHYVALLMVVPAITVVVALTEPHHHLLYVESTLVEQGGRMVLEQTGGPWFWLAAGYTYFLGLLGSLPLLGLIRSDAVTFRGQGAALLIGTLAPWASNALFLAGVIPNAVVDPTPIAFAISGAAYLGALSRFRLFSTSPSPNRHARRLVFERMHEGAIVVDSHDYVVDMNDNAASILDRSPREVLGRPATDVVPAFDRLPADGPAADHITVDDGEGSQFYDVAVTRISDAHGRTLGRVLTFHDVGEHLRQQQRLEVLNRVLRHNIRNETNLITGYADLMGDDDGMDVMVKESAGRIEEMGEKARIIGDLFEQGAGGHEPVAIDELLDDVIESVGAAHPTVTIERQPLPGSITVAGVLRDVVENVLENAAEHNTNDDPHVRVRVELEPERARIIVVDNGPGITDYERSVLEDGTETPLEHGSGLGLWLIKWGVEIAGGRLTIEDRDPTGSIVTLHVPVLDRGGEAAGRPSAEPSRIPD